MSPIQQMLLGVGAVATKTYIDDIFSTYLHTGTGSAKSINNGIDLAGEGGLVWGKSRSHSHTHVLIDTVRGASNGLLSQSTNAEYAYSPALITSFNNNGYSVAADGSGSINYVESGGNKLTSWTFRKAPGFFDVVTYTGTGSTRTVAHSLGCVPGFIIIKCRSDADQWECFHDALGITKAIRLESNDGAFTDSNGERWGNTLPTSTHFTVNSNNGLNGNGRTYVAYLFAGGESTAATARSVDFDGTDDYLSIGSSSDYDYGTGDFCIEGWYLADSLSSGGYHKRLFLNGSSNADSLQIFVRKDNNKIYFNVTGSPLVGSSEPMTIGQWTHIAVVRHSSVVTLYVNGISVDSASYSSDIDHQSSSFYIGTHPEDSNATWNGKISNFRVVKGSAVYTSSFKPPTEPLTNITNTTILCCNNSSVTGSTVTPGTITANSSPTASTDSPFDDPAGFVFGDAGDQNVIKTGSYVGSGTEGLEVNLGWEPQWVMVKGTSANKNWRLWDSMRGAPTGGDVSVLFPNLTNQELTYSSRVDFQPTGFKLTGTSGQNNASGETYIFVALRRPDGYVGKPPSLGTDVFAMGMSNGSSTTPCHITNFVTDFGLIRTLTSTSSWYAAARLISGKYLRTDLTNSESNGADYTFDSNIGFIKGSNTDWAHWGWKRHAGFDVVTYTGDGSLRTISHSMGIAPEMMWFKKRNDSKNWYVYHKGLDGGSSPEDYSLRLNTTAAQDQDGNTLWNETVPTATHFTINTDSGVNADGDDYIAMLFASTDVSKVGYYNGSDSAQTITTGFQPRFVIIKRSSDADNWFVLDTTRGYGSGNDQSLELDTNNAQSSVQAGAPTSTGFTVPALSGNDFAYGVNGNGYKFVYYAHA